MSTTTDPEEPTQRAASEAHPDTCPVAWCPICLAVSVVQPLAPEVVTHLLKAGTEMFLALQAIMDARAEDLEPTEPAEPLRLEKIDVG
jgi:hypothetical protein